MTKKFAILHRENAKCGTHMYANVDCIIKTNTFDWERALSIFSICLAMYT